MIRLFEERRTVRGMVLATLLVAAATGAAMAASPPNTPAATPGAAISAAPTITEAPTASVNGFRTAQFGMTQADVKTAIIKDFGIKADAIVAGENAAERTSLLTITAPDVLQGGGTAQVSYVFGYKSKTLIQVGVAWSSATDATLTEAELYADGDVLRTHFLAAGYKPDTVKTGLVLQNGVLLFRGEDAKGHATILILQGTYKDAADGKQRVLTPASLALLYSADPQNPDVFKLAPGQF